MMESHTLSINTLPGESVRREAARWVLWCYIVIAILSSVLHIINVSAKGNRVNLVFLIPATVIGITALIATFRLKYSLSNAMMLFAWITFVCLVIWFLHDVNRGGKFTNVTAMFVVGIFTLGIILGFKAAVSYATAAAVVFITVGTIYSLLPKMVVPVILAYAVALPSKLVERLIEQSTQDLEQLNQRLEDLVAERTAELAESNLQLRAEVSDRVDVEEELRRRTVELESHNEELNAYAHTVAHDIKSPLASIIGFGELLERHSTQFSEEQLTYYFSVIARNGRKITNIVDELLLLSSVREAKVVDSGPLDMAAIIDEAQQRLIHDIAEKSPEFVLPDVWPVALGYAPWVEEIWTNYISNAIKYGGDPPRIELGYTILDLERHRYASKIQNSKSRIVFWLRDNGPGLTPKEQGRLFTPFTRFDHVRAKGHGLGLSIVRRIAERLDGEVGVESEVGEGSTFFFTLPAAQTQPVQTQPVQTPGGGDDAPGEAG